MLKKRRSTVEVITDAVLEKAHSTQKIMDYLSVPQVRCQTARPFLRALADCVPRSRVSGGALFSLSWSTTCVCSVRSRVRSRSRPTAPSAATRSCSSELFK